MNLFETLMGCTDPMDNREIWASVPFMRDSESLMTEKRYHDRMGTHYHPPVPEGYAFFGGCAQIAGELHDVIENDWHEEYTTNVEVEEGSEKYHELKDRFCQNAREFYSEYIIDNRED